MTICIPARTRPVIGSIYSKRNCYISSCIWYGHCGRFYDFSPWDALPKEISSCQIAPIMLSYGGWYRRKGSTFMMKKMYDWTPHVTVLSWWNIRSLKHCLIQNRINANHLHFNHIQAIRLSKFTIRLLRQKYMVYKQLEITWEFQYSWWHVQKTTLSHSNSFLIETSSAGNRSIHMYLRNFIPIIFNT